MKPVGSPKTHGSVSIEMRRSFQRPREWGRRFLLVLVALVISLAAAEGLLRWLDFLDSPVFEENSSYGYLMRPDQSVSPRGHRFQINHAGLRGVNFEADKPPQTFRVAFLGDSITYGGGEVPDKDLFVNSVASSLEIQGNRFIESLNLSVPGWGIQNMEGYISSKGFYHADLLVWVLPSVDFRRPQTTLEENGFLEVKPWSRIIYGGFLLVWKSSQAMKWHLGFGQGEAKAEPGSEILVKNLQAFHRTLAGVKDKGVSCLVVIVPAAGGYGPLDEDFVKFRSQAESLDIPTLDMRPIFEQHSSREVFFDGVHLTSRGHELVAESIVGFLKGSSGQGGSLP